MSQSDRAVLVHHHIFKNAGMSFDHLLSESFGPSWVALELPRAGDVLRAEQLLAFLGQNPGMRAVSSHQARLLGRPPAGMDVYPVVFLRHPVDRAESVYLFESRARQTHASARVAAGASFAEYVAWCLRDRADGTCVIRDYQTIHLSDALLRVRESVRARARAADLALAKQRLAGLPAFGLVERFDESLDQLRAWLLPAFPELRLRPVAVNASPGRGGTLEGRIRRARAALGQDLFLRLLDHNAYDLDLYDFARRLFLRRQGRLGHGGPGEAAGRLDPSHPLPLARPWRGLVGPRRGLAGAA
jgi:hypothetical protein